MANLRRWCARRTASGCAWKSLEELDEWVTADQRSVEEQIRPLRERALRAHERTGPS